MRKQFTILMALALVVMLVSSCAVPSGASLTSPPSGQPADTGTVAIWVTDAPRSDNVTEIWVKVSQVEIHKATAEQKQEQEQDQNGGGQTQEQDQDSEQEGEGDGEWISANISGPNPFELLALKDGGIQQVLATADIAPGKYTQIRMTIEEAWVTIAGDNISATVPSDKLKFVQPFEVEEGKETKLLFDFDAEKSVKVNYIGSDKEPKVILTPVIKLIVEKPGPTEGAVKITTPSLPNGGVDVFYNTTLQATGGTTPYTWSFLSGDWPAGLTLHEDSGVIDGYPTTPRDYTFTIQVSDNSTPHKSNIRQYTVTIAATGVLIITTTSLPDGKEGQAYSATVLAIGGTTPYTWSITAGNLPDGLSLNPDTGLISGIPTKNGNFNFTVQVSDSSASDNQSLSIQIATD
jgi:hypothetical protein